ncbi:hypothetical protein VOLCADRAFT_57524 [Volvox carteri f. nagariensis]|uniref:DUF962 domain-containing protein n=1 Tax=Volvox carteri f. nagariensis TaxID=3068 RepID=D8TN61_VOLCA|nr:uncharacterized protein VOLCADRAFT_57524 [Volvox carteri f. nagariensis]EFJ51084.1 hypothetical protein VOLCADRAFT_57524 [Volvox carteri f. nagariensis]|eukprot:XP_002948096.1 hypothetical protein VOLCADRAFT_57524 [Volvox carteri f. nagariensis]
MGGLSLDLPEQLAFYGSYHNHPLNQLIHFFCVPAILWSCFVWLSAAGPLLPVPALAPPTWLGPAWAAALQPTNPAFLLVAAYSAFYLALDLFAGTTWALVVGLPLAWTATAFTAAIPRAWAWALSVHVLGWYMQIHPGHAVLERRKPALMDSLVQAFALAPLFVWFEALFLLGYRPALREQLKRRVAQLIADMDARRQPLTSSN